MKNIKTWSMCIFSVRYTLFVVELMTINQLSSSFRVDKDCVWQTNLLKGTWTSKIVFG